MGLVNCTVYEEYQLQFERQNDLKLLTDYGIIISHGVITKYKPRRGKNE